MCLIATLIHKKTLNKVARETGFEPAASAVTGQRSNQLNYSRAWWVLRDLNSRPSRCKRDALPTELNTQIKAAVKFI